MILLLEFEMPCHRMIRYFKGSIFFFFLQTEARYNLGDFHFRFWNGRR